MKMLKGLLAAGMLVAVGAVATAADAAVQITIQQDGANVVTKASGTFDIAGASFLALIDNNSSIYSKYGFIAVGDSATARLYQRTGPSSFGTGSYVSANSSSGTSIGLVDGFFSLANSYISNSAISASSVYNGVTLADLGLTTGVYNYTVGSNAVTLTVSSSGLTAGVPEPATWAMMMLGFGGMGYAMRRKKTVTRIRFA